MQPNMATVATADVTGELNRERHRPALQIEIDHLIACALRPEAAKRDVSVARLCIDILEVIGRDHLTGAVLDDLPAETQPARPRRPGRPRLAPG